MNPGSVGVALGLPLFLFSLKMPECIGAPVKMTANLNTPLAMIVIGFNLADAEFGPVLRDRMAYVAGALRLLIVPLLFLGTIFALRRFAVSLDGKMAVAVVTAACAPVAAFNAMFAVKS